ERCHCEARSGEAIQMGRAFTLGCFAPLAMTGGLLAMTGSVVIARRVAAKQSRWGGPSPWIASLGNVRSQ
ncbi:MAG: hypothetical protein LBT00_02860, partial [Spirochaetaceae bacterium]|nr:hypothetical protein [Spirochaetaceae bacterium]